MQKRKAEGGGTGRVLLILPEIKSFVIFNWYDESKTCSWFKESKSKFLPEQQHENQTR